MKTLNSALAMALLVVGTQGALAADDDLAKRVAACTHEQDDARRLACFDRAAAPKASVQKASPREAGAAKADATETFGVKGSELARSQDDGDEPQQSAPPQRLTAKVTGLDTRARGELVVTLDNGQVWAQKEKGAYLPIKVGDSVTILAGSLGSFHLVVANRATAVTRVR